MLKAICTKTTAKISLNEEKLKTFSLKLAKDKIFSISQYLFNEIFENLYGTIRKMKETKGIQIGKDETKVSLLANEILLYT